MPHPDPEPRHMSREPSDKKLHMHQHPLLLPAENQEGRAWPGTIAINPTRHQPV